MMKMKKFFYLFVAGMIITGCNDTSDLFSDVNLTDDTGVAVQTKNESIPKRAPMAETKATSWYIRLVASDVSSGISSSDAQLGVLEEEGATVKHTLSAFPPMGGNYLDVVFVDPAGVTAGSYKTNFQQFTGNSEYRWRFTVRTDNVNHQIALTWRGVYVLTPYIDAQNRQRYKERRSMTNPIIQNMRLVDVATGNTMFVLSGKQPKVYYFNMNGQNERTFEWIVVPDSNVTAVSKVQ